MCDVDVTSGAAIDQPTRANGHLTPGTIMNAIIPAFIDCGPPVGFAVTIIV
jgi:hypothetical protein